MSRTMFVLGREGRYLYSSPTRMAWNRLPKDFEDLLQKQVVSRVICASFGESDQDCVILYADKRVDDKISILYGENTPQELKDWLQCKDRTETDRQHTKVVLGRGKTFIAWSPSSIRWSGLPLRLETALQSWLSPAGWRVGPPRLVTLGVDDSFFALSEYGAVSYQLKGTMPDTKRAFHAYQGKAGFNWAQFEYITFSVAEADQYVIVFANSSVDSNINKEKHFRTVADSFASKEVLEQYEKERSAARQSMLKLQYTEWVSLCQAAFSADNSLDFFPFLSDEVCECSIDFCMIRKSSIGLGACRHDIEQLLRASGNYQKAWLRSQRLAWHPDRFSRKCHPLERARLVKLATEMYSIFEELIASEP